MKRYFLTLLMTASIFLAGCSGYNPVAVAETPEQKADAVYATFVIFEERAADLAAKPGTPQSVINSLARADRVVKPIMDNLQAAVSEVAKVRADIARGGDSTQDMLTVVTLNLEKWLIEAAPALQALIDAVAGAGDRVGIGYVRLEWRYA
jgi:hypothetical protein